ncbi:hypothetical protein N7467_001599 [Penicillium canescens]|nr:hypothetical protein N7467_001599 [Penicillium canescens]
MANGPITRLVTQPHESLSRRSYPATPNPPHDPHYFSSAHSLSCTDTSSSWSLVIGLIIIVAASVAAWFLSPKGENQTLFRSTLILTFVSCYLMWGTYSDYLLAHVYQPLYLLFGIWYAIVFLSQWHPLIAPKRADIRPDRVPN